MKDGEPAICSVCGFVDKKSGPDLSMKALYPHDRAVLDGAEPDRCTHMFYRMPARTWCGAGKHAGCPCHKEHFFNGGPCVCLCHVGNFASEVEVQQTIEALQNIADDLTLDSVIAGTYLAGLNFTFDIGGIPHGIIH